MSSGENVGEGAARIFRRERTPQEYALAPAGVPEGDARLDVDPVMERKMPRAGRDVHEILRDNDRYIRGMNAMVSHADWEPYIRNWVELYVWAQNRVRQDAAQPTQRETLREYGTMVVFTIVGLLVLFLLSALSTWVSTALGGGTWSNLATAVLIGGPLGVVIQYVRGRWPA